MRRRILFTTAAVVFLAGVILYAAKFIDVPNVTFAQATQIGDPQRKVMVTGRVLPNREITPEDGTVTFYMADGDGAEFRVLYDGSDSLSPKALKDAAQYGKQVSVAGHSDGDHFHTSSVYFR